MKLARPSLVLAAAVLAALATGPAQAGDPSSEDIVRGLTRPKGGVATRGFTPSGRGISVDGRPAEAAPAVDLTINFEFNSARLLPDGEVLAANLGRALKDPRLAADRFRIEGHTDAVGGPDFNQRLSEARARAVRDYLVQRFGVDAARLEVVGYGFTRLADPGQPTAAANRRVRVSNLGR